MPLRDPPEDEDCDVAELLDRLNDIMISYRPELRGYLKNALIPTVHHKMRLHGALRDEIDSICNRHLRSYLSTRCARTSSLSG